MSTPAPRAILGLMTFGPPGGPGARIDKLDDFKKCLDYFQDQGFDEADTARLYIHGQQEAFTAEAGWKERGLKMATKWYPIQPGMFKAETVKAMANKSLQELKTDSVDIWYLHAADRSVPITETLGAVNELYKEGKFKKLGLSNFSAFEVAEAVTICIERGWVRPSIYQGCYNAITRTIETELIPCCRRFGLDIVIFNPLAGGMLAKKYDKAEVPLKGRFSDAEGGGMGAMYRARYLKDATFEAIQLLEPVVEGHGLTMAETALRWCVHHSALKAFPPGKDGIIIGVSSFKQLESNVQDLKKGPLPQAVVEALDEAWLLVKPTAANPWHGNLDYTYQV
ncbi:aflatoxin B1 aldehyde reductase member 2 [Lophium mytilinum]|uniref:Aflatoxin B1 aldehyde reductase member 2 n=1 Tax=Lophium mytilinum TaxID=390894 RepID=A0A6A6QRT9_9PEZI|nr:aflatoxin B1 aldehyde reductase member 2 [Lophium mytilinum]